MDHKKFSTVDLVRLNKIYKKKTALKMEIEELESEFNEITAKMRSIGCIIDGRIEDPKTRHWRIGRRKFNYDPQEGIDYLVAKNVLMRTPQSIGNFLTDRTLNSRSVGDYLGNISNPFNCDVLRTYIDLFDFTGMEFIDSLRFFLSGFHLPGESQKIDKIISTWASYYHDQNPGIFRNGGETYIMTYAVIMLNTCLHNPTAKKDNGGFGREEDFIKIMRNFDSETNFDLDFVKKIFKNIKTNPLSCLHKPNKERKYEKDIINMEKVGWLWKLGGRIKNLKKRWFVLSEFTLFYFIHPDSPTMKGMIPLENVIMRVCSEKFGKFGFEIYSDESETVKGCKSDKDGRIIAGRHCSYKIYSTSKAEIEIWMDAIQRTINGMAQMRLIRAME